jgi:hypothetical protein
MDTGRTEFTKLLAVATFSHFEHLVDKYKANRWKWDFTAWNHFICMTYHTCLHGNAAGYRAVVCI